MSAAHQSRSPQTDRTLVRDAALVRISRTRRLAFAGAAALTAGLAALASALLPGKSFGAASHTVTRANTSSSITPALPAPASAAQLGLTSSGQAQQSAPAPAPAPTPAPAPAQSSGGSAVVSGGS